MKIILILIVCGLCGCNMQTSANSVRDLGRINDGVQLSDFGGNVAFAATDDSVEAPVKPTTDSVTGSVLANYSTSFNPRASARKNNIELAVKAIDKTILQPDEVLSFNNAVGPANKEAGFKLARIFIKGKDAEGYGGGICQVSSTLYNAALDAELEIVERHPHSKPVGYVPEGRDATTSYGGKDLKISNNKGFPIIINSSVDNGKIVVEIISA